MPLLDIATAQASLHRNYIHTFRCQAILRSKFVYRNEKQFGLTWKSFSIQEKANNFNSGRFHTCSGRLIIKAVATLEPTRLTQRNKEFSLRVDVDSGGSTVPGVEQPSSGRDSTEPNDRERLRRMRISKANKGNTPWNKGKKHSPETLQRIRERTKLAMQDPKVKMKLVKLGHAQSEETRIKIGVGVRIGWEKRREMLMLQETCLYQWQNLIAEASRKGVLGEEELQWNSYKFLDEQLEQEWLQSVQERKRMPRVKGSKRAPKSLEQRRKISEAITAKWADLSYRNRVCSGLAKYHGITGEVERKPRKKPSSDGQTRKENPSKSKVDSDDFSNPEPRRQIPRVRNSSRVAAYKDPLASSKLEMLKNIRAQRAATESKKTEAIVRAKLLIAEAEKAANALEAAAKKSPLAHASLVETRRLIAEAILFMSSIDEGQVDSRNDGNISVASPEFVSHTELGMSAGLDESIQTNERRVNGAHILGSSNCANTGFSFQKSAFQDLGDTSSNRDIMGFKFEIRRVQDSVDDTEQTKQSSFCGQDIVNGQEILHQTRCINVNLTPRLLDKALKPPSFPEHLGDRRLNGSIEPEHNPHQVNGKELQPRKEEKPPKSANVTKKWVRGKLVGIEGREIV